MRNQLSDKLITAMTESLPPKTNLANYLTEEIHISKEAAYRRLRGDVPFTLDEAAQVVSKLNLSLDKIIGNSGNSGAIVNMSLTKHQKPIDNYHETISHFLKLSNLIKDGASVQLSCATNMIPFILCEPYQYLTKFRICRWLHQSNNIKSTGSLSDIEISNKTIKLQRILAEKTRNVSTSLYILDVDIILSFINQVKLFNNLRLLSLEDIFKIKEELHALIDDVENIASNGYFKNGGRVYVYLSNINLEASYGYVESENLQISTIRIYAINLIDSEHPDICRLQKEWIQSLRRYSTLITESSEMERLRFFKLQREYVNSL